MNSLLVRLLSVTPALLGTWIATAQAGPETWALTTVNGTTSTPAGGFVVDTTNRMESLSFYNAVYLASEGAENRIGWTGSFSGSCVRGSTSTAFREDVRRRVNYYRALCGLPANITFDAEPAINDGPAGSPTVPATTTKRTCAQAAAYMNSFSNVFFDNFAISHNPASATTACYSSSAWNGCYNGNLALGYFGPRAIDVYMEDDDLADDQSNNVNVGHRRWILYSRARDMSTGDVPAGTYVSAGITSPVLPSNVLYIAGIFTPVATAPKQFVTWPSRGYVARTQYPLRWSISYPGASFPSAAANIVLTNSGGTRIPVTVISSNSPLLGDNSIVFTPQNLVLPAGDATYNVTITGLTGTGVPASYTWQTTFFDPSDIGVTQTVSGPVQPPRSGADYQVTPAPLAGRYQVLVSQPTTAASYLENGEGTTPDLVIDKTGTYPLLQTSGSLNGLTFTPRGTKSMHLCFPLDSSEIDYLPHSQAFSLGPEFIPAANSTLTFAELFRWLFTVNRLSVELSSDGGTKYTEIYGRNGAYTYVAPTTAVPNPTYDSTKWDTAWSTRSVSLAAWAGQPIRLRFILRPGDTSFDGPDIHHGCYLDDITLTNVRRIPAGSGTGTVMDQTVFTLNQQTAGGALQSGSPYLLRVRTEIGNRYMGYSQPLTVTPAPPTGFETTWPALATLPYADADNDGISNFLEYAFGLNPTLPNVGNLPQPSVSATGITYNFTVPAGITDLTYTAERTTNFSTWQPVPNQGTGSQRLFTVPFSTGPRSFLRLRVTQNAP